MTQPRLQESDVERQVAAECDLYRETLRLIERDGASAVDRARARFALQGGWGRFDQEHTEGEG